MSDVVIRRAEQRDIEPIGRINQGVFLGDRNQQEGAAHWIQCWFNAFPLYQYFVVEYEGEVVGYAGWQLHGGFHRPEPVIELDQVGVLPSHQGKGLAPRLIQECMMQLVEWTKKENDRIESHLTFVVWAYALNFNAVSVYAKYFTDGVRRERCLDRKPRTYFDSVPDEGIMTDLIERAFDELFELFEFAGF